MTRANARELAVHLIYSREFTGEEPEQLVAERLDKEYYSKLAQENEIYQERPNGPQVRYLDAVVSGVANRTEELNEQIGKFSIGWNVSRISRLTRCVILYRLTHSSMKTTSPRYPIAWEKEASNLTKSYQLSSQMMVDT